MILRPLLCTENYMLGRHFMSQPKKNTHRAHSQGHAFRLGCGRGYVFSVRSAFLLSGFLYSNSFVLPREKKLTTAAKFLQLASVKFIVASPALKSAVLRAFFSISRSRDTNATFMKHLKSAWAAAMPLRSFQLQLLGKRRLQLSGS